MPDELRDEPPEPNRLFEFRFPLLPLPKPELPDPKPPPLLPKPPEFPNPPPPPPNPPELPNPPPPNPPPELPNPPPELPNPPPDWPKPEPWLPFRLLLRLFRPPRVVPPIMPVPLPPDAVLIGPDPRDMPDRELPPPDRLDEPPPPPRFATGLPIGRLLSMISAMANSLSCKTSVSIGNCAALDSRKSSFETRALAGDSFTNAS